MRREATENGKRWLEQAIENLKCAKDLAERGGYHIFCFLAQQVREKAVKAFLYTQGKEILIARSVESLGNFTQKFDVKFPEKVKRWAILDGYQVPTGYPNSLPDGISARVYTEDAANGAVRLAEETVDFVSEKTGTAGSR